MDLRARCVATFLFPISIRADHGLGHDVGLGRLYQSHRRAPTRSSPSMVARGWITSRFRRLQALAERHVVFWRPARRESRRCPRTRQSSFGRGRCRTWTSCAGHFHLATVTLDAHSAGRCFRRVGRDRPSGRSAMVFFGPVPPGWRSNGGTARASTHVSTAQQAKSGADNRRILDASLNAEALQVVATG